MTDASVATDVHQTFDVQLHFRTEVTFHFVLSTDNFTNLSGLIICPVLYFDITINACFS